MADEYISLAKELEKSLSVSRKDFANYLFARARVLIEESGDKIAIEISERINAKIEIYISMLMIASTQHRTSRSSVVIMFSCFYWFCKNTRQDPQTVYLSNFATNIAPL